jgi:phage shock protein A
VGHVYQAFGLGEDDKHIATVDADGVALAAIQALYKLVLQKDEQIQKLAQQLEALRGQIARLQPPAGSSTH